jgi:hypothetical protein
VGGVTVFLTTTVVGFTIESELLSNYSWFHTDGPSLENPQKMRTAEIESVSKTHMAKGITVL